MTLRACEAGKAGTDTQGRFYHLQASLREGFASFSFRPAEMCFGIMRPVEQGLSRGAIEVVFVSQLCRSVYANVFGGVEQAQHTVGGEETCPFGECGKWVRQQEEDVGGGYQVEGGRWKG